MTATCSLAQHSTTYGLCHQIQQMLDVLALIYGTIHVLRITSRKLEFANSNRCPIGNMGLASKALKKAAMNIPSLSRKNKSLLKATDTPTQTVLRLPNSRGQPKQTFRCLTRHITISACCWQPILYLEITSPPGPDQSSHLHLRCISPPLKAARSVFDACLKPANIFNNHITSDTPFRSCLWFTSWI